MRVSVGVVVVGIVGVVTGLLLTNAEHGEELSAELAAREEVEEKVGDVVEVEEEMRETGEEFVFYGRLDLRLGRLRDQRVVVVIQVVEYLYKTKIMI